MGEGLAFTRVGRAPDSAAVVTIQRFTVEAHYIDLFLRPGYLARIVMNGFRVHVPHFGADLQTTNWRETKSSFRGGVIVPDGAVVEIDQTDTGAPLLFDIHTLKLTSVSQNKPMSYDVSFHSPLPPGEIHAHGQFGPWNSSEPPQTPVSGQSAFQNADLVVFDGIEDIFSSEEKFQGILNQIETQGNMDIPDFTVLGIKLSVQLKADSHAFVNGTNGDVEVERVSASFLKSRVLAKARIAGHSGQHGKTAAVDLNVHDGRIQDVLWLFFRKPKPPYNGVTKFRAHIVIPPGKRAFLHRMQFIAIFSIEDGQFIKTTTQNDVDGLSNKALGAKRGEKAQADDPESVVSDLAGHVELRNATATFGDLSFIVPGAFALLHATFNLECEALDLRGTLKTDVELSKLSSGFKSVVLKPFDVFFKRKHAGAVVPVHLIGTYNNPQPASTCP